MHGSVYPLRGFLAFLIIWLAYNLVNKSKVIVSAKNVPYFKNDVKVTSSVITVKS